MSLSWLKKQLSQEHDTSVFLLTNLDIKYIEMIKDCGGVLISVKEYHNENKIYAE